MSSTLDKSIRVWMDGCFDLVHCGHADAFRQAKALGDYLIVGIHSDAEIRKNKGPPVSTEEERYKLARAIKWVDEVVENAPYVPTVDTLNKYQCDFCVHGEELALGTDGTDYHEPVKTAGRYKDLKRTYEISTTNLIRRMLNLSAHGDENTQTKSPIVNIKTDELSDILKVKLTQFSNGRIANPNDRIVYAPGVYDLFHTGHVDFLEKGKLLGDYLIVGVYEDENAKFYHGNKNPILNVHERALAVMACRFVDEVILGAPCVITKEFLDGLNIELVIHGETKYPSAVERQDLFEIPKSLGKFKTINSGNSLHSSDIIFRVLQNRSAYEIRNSKKQANETQGYENYFIKSEL